ncbi:5'-nucleotidase domain-containing protein [Advenella kashmirensis WT001]|uniref:5'-nucleotidase domain-containing protein n=1 Tax=Advenella kashmirensis (strain DSM 17095 / LMG 22695 / WT001) TaxID=1036672 RepID=I3UAV3_ADVKW|nr:thiosulfohydrolase SoxB [Advenella kashmirensis]AFK62141.1 5'-nucleotidase domain-containing protein [Advenella kashmirensis WT001]
MNRREFLQILAIASAGGYAFPKDVLAADKDMQTFYDMPTFGNVSFLHFTDSHAQLLPIYYREPSVNIGLGASLNKAPHLVGDAFLKEFGMKANSMQAYAFTALDYNESANRFGKVGGFAHLATLIKRLKADRPHALVLDGGDTWQGSATSLWTKGQDMIDASLLLGVDMMTAHWEFTYGMDRVQEAVEGLKGKINFLAQNVETSDFGDPVFEPYAIRQINGVQVAVIGQAFPYTPIANPRYMVSDWTFGIQDQKLQETVDEVRGKGVAAVIVLSHNGMDVDLKLASKVTGIDAILGGHTHDGVPEPVIVSNAKGKTLVTNAGSNGKYLGVLDLDVDKGGVKGYQYKLLPVFSNFLDPDPQMEKLIQSVRAPYLDKLGEKLAVTNELLYRRGNFNGSFDQLIVDALLQEKGAQIAFSPGFRWGTTLLPGQAITMEDVMNQTAITYPGTTLNEMSGETIKTVLEDVADNLFNTDPYYQQGGDMVRVGGLNYTIDPNQTMGNRISNMTLNDKPLEAGKIYKVAGWASVQESSEQGEPIWELVSRYLKDKKVVGDIQLNTPQIKGIENNQGFM